MKDIISEAFRNLTEMDSLPADFEEKKAKFEAFVKEKGMMGEPKVFFEYGYIHYNVVVSKTIDGDYEIEKHTNVEIERWGDAFDSGITLYISEDDLADGLAEEVKAEFVKSYEEKPDDAFIFDDDIDYFNYENNLEAEGPYLSDIYGDFSVDVGFAFKENK